MQHPAGVQTLFTQLAAVSGWGETWEQIKPNAAQAVAPNDVNRFARPEEIAAAVAYLASPLVDYVSGATLRVDGGTLRSAF